MNRSTRLLICAALSAAFAVVAPCTARAEPELHVSFTTAGEAAPGVVAEPSDCIGPLSPLLGSFSVTNGGDAVTAAAVTVTLDPGLTAEPDSCIADLGVCLVVDPQTITWSAMLDAETTANVVYQVRVSSDVPEGTQLCATLVAVFGTNPPITVKACITTNSARQCGLGAPAIGTLGLAVLVVALLLGGGVVVRRRGTAEGRAGAHH